MAESIEDQIVREVEQAAHLYHRLVLVVAPSGSGKTSALRQVHERLGAPLVNINLDLSRRMLDLTERQRALRVPQLLDEIVAQDRSDPVSMFWVQNKAPTRGLTRPRRVGYSHG